MVVCLITHNSTLAMIMVLLMGMLATVSSSTVVFIYCCEFLPEKYHERANILYFAVYVTVQSILAFYFQFVSNDYKYITVVGAVGIAMVFVCTAIFSESPIWLFKNG